MRSCVLALVLLLVRNARAEDASVRPESESPTEEVETGELELGAAGVIDARAPEARPSSASERSVEPGLLRAVPRSSTESLWTLVPSAFLVNHSGTYHASSVFFRGFDAGEGQDLEVLVDGVPINEPSNAHGHGYADTHFVIPEVVLRLRALPGPFAAEQSDFAVAGTMAHELGVARRGVRVALGAGSFDTQRLVGVVAPAGMETGTFLALDLRRSSGFGTNRSALSAAAMGRLELEVAPSLWVHVLAAGHAAEFASAGVVARRDLEAGRWSCGTEPFFCTPDPNQGGASARGLLAVGVGLRRPQERLDLTIFGGYRSLRIRENFTGFLVSEEGDGLDEQVGTAQLGARGRYRLGFTLLGRAHVFDAGLIVRRTDGESRMLRVRRSDGAPHTAVFDDVLRLTHVGGHLGVELSFADALDASLAVRADAFLLGTTERSLARVDRMGERVPERSDDAFGLAVQPRGTVRVHLFGAGAPEAPLPMRLDWTTSFGVGSRSADAIGLSTGERAPFAEVVASETGFVFGMEEASVAVEAQLSAFHTYVARDLVFSPTAGRNEPIGASSRLGAQVFVRLGVERWLDVAASFAWTQAYLLDAGASAWWNVVSSTALPYVPRWVGRLDAAVERPFALLGEPFVAGVALGIGALGERPLPLGGLAEPVVLVDASAHVGWRVLEVGVQVQNLFDARWASSVFDFAARWDPSAPATGVPDLHVAAGAPLAVFVTLALQIGETAAATEAGTETEAETEAATATETEAETGTATGTATEAATEAATETAAATEAETATEAANPGAGDENDARRGP